MKAAIAKNAIGPKAALCLCLANVFFPSCERPDPGLYEGMESAKKGWIATRQILNSNIDPAYNSATFDSVLGLINDARFSISGTRHHDWSLDFLDKMPRDEAIDSLIASGSEHFEYISGRQVDRVEARERALKMLDSAEMALELQYLKAADPLPQ